MEIAVKFTWYADERIWLATASTDDFAMTLDHGSFDALLEKTKIALYDIAENELGYTGDINIKLEIDCTVKIENRHTANGILKDAGIKMKV
jgi:hypothetical protein